MQLLQLLWLLLPFILWIVGLTAFTAYVYIKTPDRYGLKFAAIPLAFIVAFFSFNIFLGSIGISYPHQLPETFEYLDSRLIAKDGKKNSFEVWVNEGAHSRLYLIPYSKNMEEQLNAAKARKLKGGRVIFSKKKPDGKKAHDGPIPDFPDEDDTYEIRSDLLRDRFPKIEPDPNNPMLVPQVPQALISSDRKH